MGDPRQQRKKFSRPSHPWQRTRIDEEHALRNKYGLGNMREIWKMKSLLSKYASQAKRLTGTKTAQAEVEKKLIMQKLRSYGLLTSTSQLSDILNLKVDDFMDRRLQSVVFKKGLARTPRQARQFITHRHITIGDKQVTTPSYLVNTTEENSITFHLNSSLVDGMHPERVPVAKKEKAAQKSAESTP